jgi:hypothetical protein
MNRRDFVRASLALPGAARLFGQFTPDDALRRFEVTTRVEVLKPSGATRVWVPAALTMWTPYQKTLANHFQCDGGTAKMVVQNESDGGAIVAAEFPAGVRPILTVTSRVATKDRPATLSARSCGIFCARQSICPLTAS